MEGVDRNTLPETLYIDKDGSPSSRRAWIEILPYTAYRSRASVALLTEGADRNYNAKAVEVSTPSRPPRGGRG